MGDWDLFTVTTVYDDVVTVSIPMTWDAIMRKYRKSPADAVTEIKIERVMRRPM